LFCTGFIADGAKELMKKICNCQSVLKARTPNSAGYSYYGEYPLSFAASTGNAELYELLADRGADPNRQDLLGNAVLHMLVIHNKTELYRLALRHPSQPADPQLRNLARLNPVSLAAKLGRRDAFNEIIGLGSSEMWRYGNITCRVFPLTGLDTIGPDGRTDWDSALLHIINGNSEQHLDMLDEGVIGQLLAEKWHKYARSRFVQRLIMIILHLLIMTFAIYMRPLGSATAKQGLVQIGDNYTEYNTTAAPTLPAKM
uniref:ANK_REP_REGION domain-containing protein n=1 Tax=Macrostomum lignano TaxID=282301 RepID=A0A1I8JDW1_9PLAT